MKHMKNRYCKILLGGIIAAAGVLNCAAQEQITVKALFEYPVAPDSLPDLQSRSNYIIENFWKPFDFKQKVVGQIPLDHAFSVYTMPMSWASSNIVDASVEQILKKLEKNPVLLYQFVKAAENNMYSGNSEIWIDDVYMKFLKAITSNKKISNLKKARYNMQKTQLENSMVGNKLGAFEYTNLNGDKIKFQPTAPLTLIEFGSPSCADCRMAKLKMDVNEEFGQLVKDGKVEVCFIVPDAESEDDWQTELASYPATWTVGAGEGLDEIFDMRSTPTLYLLDNTGTILRKHLSIAEMMDIIINESRK
jgi:thioredoxin-related protein